MPGFSTAPSKTRNLLIANFLSLSSVQLLNGLLPLLTVPYLVRVIGPEFFGLVAFSQAFCQYFILLSDYGFNLSATKEIAVCRNDPPQLEKVFSTVLSIKAALTSFGFLIFLLTVMLFPKLRTFWPLHIITFATVVGNALFPTWLFQGLQKMTQIAILNIIPRAVATSLVFFLIREQSDYWVAAALNSAAQFITALAGLYIVHNRFGLRFVNFTRHDLKRQIADGWHVFISTVAISFFSIGNTFILGAFATFTTVGYYSAAEKIVRALMAILATASQTVYPHVTALAKESRAAALAFVAKTLVLFAAAGGGVTLGLILFASHIVAVVLGPQYLPSVPVLRVLSLLPLAVVLSNIFGIQVMLPFDMKRPFSTIIIAGGILNLALSLLLAPLLYHIGVSIAVVATECFIAVAMYLYLRQRGIRLILLSANYLNDLLPVARRL